VRECRNGPLPQRPPLDEQLRVCEHRDTQPDGSGLDGPAEHFETAWLTAVPLWRRAIYRPAPTHVLCLCNCIRLLISRAAGSTTFTVCRKPVRTEQKRYGLVVQWATSICLLMTCYISTSLSSKQLCPASDCEYDSGCLSETQNRLSIKMTNTPSIPYHIRR
jgi:hypothetical protein